MFDLAGGGRKRPDVQPYKPPGAVKKQEGPGSKDPNANPEDQKAAGGGGGGGGGGDKSRRNRNKNKQQGRHSLRS